MPDGGSAGDVLTKGSAGYYWGAAGVGPQGPPGADGAQGPQGIQGIQGPPGADGSGQSNVSFIRVTSLAFTTTTSTLPLPMLAFSVSAQSTYAFEFGVVYASAITSTGLRLGLQFVSMSTMAAQIAIPNQAPGTAGIHHGWIAASTLTHQSTFTASSVVAANTPLASTKYVARVEGNCVPQASGQLLVTYATEVAGVAISTFAGSYGELKTIP